MTTPERSLFRRGAVWAWVPALLLGSMLLGLGVLAYLAIDDPHFALEANYYDKAVHWDRTQREARDSAALGLQLMIPKALVVAADGTVEVELRVNDRQQVPLSGAVVELEAFANAYASQIERVPLREASPGVYRGRFKARARGLWELRFEIATPSSRFRQSLRRDVGKGDAA
jgi:nitrogen fixation protein FixH